MGEVWGIEKRKFGKDWCRRLWLFDRLIWTVLSYGMEIWGWREREEIERLEERYMKWVLGLERRTPRYMVREEIKREKLSERARKRTWGFEERLREGKGSELTRLCWWEMREEAMKGKRRIGGWEEKRKRFFKDRGWEIKEVERRRKEGDGWFGELIKRNRKEQRLERKRRIRESRYNK